MTVLITVLIDVLRSVPLATHIDEGEPDCHSSPLNNLNTATADIKTAVGVFVCSPVVGTGDVSVIRPEVCVRLCSGVIITVGGKRI